MNKIECKKYIRRAYERLSYQGKSMNPENLAKEMEKEINNESKIYIAYAKIAMHNLNNSANDITAKDLIEQIDVIHKLYSKIDVIIKAENL